MDLRKCSAETIGTFLLTFALTAPQRQKLSNRQQTRRGARLIIAGEPIQKKVSTIPIVFAQVFDPLGSGLVSNLARPAGNITGFTNFEFSLIGKWLGILKEIAPQVTRVALIFSPRTATYARMLLQPIESIALSLRVETSATPVHEAVEVRRRHVAVTGRNGRAVAIASRVASRRGPDAAAPCSAQ